MVCLECGAARHHYEVDSAELLLTLAEALSNQAFEAVAVMGFADVLLGDCQAQTWEGFAVGSCQHGQPAVRGFAWLLENPLEIGGRA